MGCRGRGRDRQKYTESIDGIKERKYEERKRKNRKSNMENTLKDQNRRNLLTWQSHKVIGKGDVEQKTKQ